MKPIQATTIAFLVVGAWGGDLVYPLQERIGGTLNQHTLDGKKR